MRGRNIKSEQDLNQGPRAPNANTITTELKRIQLGIVFKSRKQPCLKEWFPVTLVVEDPQNEILCSLILVYIVRNSALRSSKHQKGRIRYMKGCQVNCS